jgi:hypothetical protein
MIDVKYGQIPNELFNNYLKYLVNKMFKVLPMKEHEVKSLNSYLRSLQIELIGSTELIGTLKNDPQFLSLMNTIQFFIDNEFNNQTCKREVFKCIHILEDLQKKYFE